MEAPDSIHMVSNHRTTTYYTQGFQKMAAAQSAKIRKVSLHRSSYYVSSLRKTFASLSSVGQFFFSFFKSEAKSYDTGCSDTSASLLEKEKDGQLA